jgi:hypothetical protein
MTEDELKHEIREVKTDLEWLVWIAMRTFDYAADEVAYKRILTMARHLNRLSDYAGCTHLFLPQSQWSPAVQET